MESEIPQDVLERLAGCREPFLIGVRHHSAALARVMPDLLAKTQPESILLELPPDFQKWIEYLGNDELEAPVALAAAGRHRLLSFYPLADFSPELIAIRWAAKHQVPVIPCDLSLEKMSLIESRFADTTAPSDSDETPIVNQLLNRYQSRDTAALWETLVETPGVNASPESIRRAGLLFGWMMRHSSRGPTPADAHRELAMREAIASAPKRSVAIVGSFHASALLEDPLLWIRPDEFEYEKGTSSPIENLTTSLIPYSYAQLDQRSGYPAGILDPVWQRSMSETSSVEQMHGVISHFATQLCRHLREAGHVAGTPDATEIVRIANDLSRLRGHSAPGRAELLEAIETTLVQGDLYGRGRAIARAAETVFIGQKTGRLPVHTPRSGISVQVEELCDRFKLPGPKSIGEDPRTMRLDPLRSKLDRARAVTFRRLNLIGVQYCERIDTEATGNRENLTEVWSVKWTHATTATLEASTIYGITLTQAAEAMVRRMENSETVGAQDRSEKLQPETMLACFRAAAECGLADSVRELLKQFDHLFMNAASANHLIEAAQGLKRISAGHIFGLPFTSEDAVDPDVPIFHCEAALLSPNSLIEKAINRLEGLRGSTEPLDITSITDLSAMLRGDEDLAHYLPALQTRLWQMTREGSPQMQGAAWGSLAMLCTIEVGQMTSVLEGWYDSASTAEGRKLLRLRLNGLMIPLLALIFSDPDWLGGLESRLKQTGDDEFLSRLPTLRGGFQSLPPADRVSLLNDRLRLIDPKGMSGTSMPLLDDPEIQAVSMKADRAGRNAILRLFPDFVIRETSVADANEQPVKLADEPGEIPLSDRWRLILGVQGCQSKKASRAGRSLDECYGASARGTLGQRADLDRGGTGKATPSAREWVEDLSGLFDQDVCEEVMADSIEGGRSAILEYLNPETVRPSVELLEQVLSLHGAMPERDLTLLRKLARKITEKLAEQLQNRLRPALTGLNTPRSTRRKSRRIDFARTIASNLETAHRQADGQIRLAPRNLFFKSPAKRQMDWHLIFVVDTSGSMEASVIYSALVSAIFASLPAIDVKFFAFSTEVIDLSNVVEDPLSLLMEVQVGGGTHIGLGLRAARESVKVPARTIVVIVSDFEEGVSVPEMLAEAKMLADSGVKLLGLAALDDAATPRYHTGIAQMLVQAGMPVAAVSPERLAQWVGDQIRGSSK